MFFECSTREEAEIAAVKSDIARRTSGDRTERDAFMSAMPL